jgi:hypothetical protein
VVSRSIFLVIAASFLAGAAVAQRASIIEVSSHAELQQKFCAADPNVEHVLVLPATLFVDAKQVICNSGPYKLYRIVDLQDTDDFSYSLDPPFYNRGARLGCDGKGGRDMRTVALNCRPL